MKNAFFLFILSAFLFSCQSDFSKLDEQQFKYENITLRGHEPSGIDNTGDYHNEGLEVVLNYYKTNSSESYTTDKAFQILDDHFTNVHDWKLVEMPTYVKDLVNDILQRDKKEKIQLAQTYVDGAKSKLSIREYELMMEILTYMDNTPLDLAAYTTRFNTLKAFYYQTNWNQHEGEGDLLGGFVNLSLGSLEFWTNELLHDEGTDVSAFYNDAVAYAIAWGAAYLSDCIENDPCPGSICPCPGEQDRINTAVIAAAAASSGKKP